jgi:hypothetical protein
MRKTRLLIVFIVALLALLVVFAPVVASPAEGAAQQEQVPTLNMFLQWLIGGGGSIMAVSWLLERMAWFQALTSDQRDYVIFGLAAGVGCGALAVVNYVPATVLDAIAPYFLVLASVFVTVFLAKTFHKADIR